MERPFPGFLPPPGSQCNPLGSVGILSFSLCRQLKCPAYSIFNSEIAAPFFLPFTPSTLKVPIIQAFWRINSGVKVKGVKTILQFSFRKLVPVKRNGILRCGSHPQIQVITTAKRHFECLPRQSCFYSTFQFIKAGMNSSS